MFKIVSLIVLDGRMFCFKCTDLHYSPDAVKQLSKPGEQVMGSYLSQKGGAQL